MTHRKWNQVTHTPKQCLQKGLYSVVNVQGLTKHHCGKGLSNVQGLNSDMCVLCVVKRERLASEKAEKEKQRKVSSSYSNNEHSSVQGRKARTSRPKTYQQQTYSNAGEAIGKMLVERRISTKLNYDVLKDIEFDLGVASNCLSSVNRNAAASANSPSALTDTSTTSQTGTPAASSSTPAANPLAITRTRVGNRLPSLSTRKRSFHLLGTGEHHHTVRPFRQVPMCSFILSRPRLSNCIFPLKF